MLTALEFYSGIGAFAQAINEFPVRIVGAFDQSVEANKTYAHNYDLTPSSANLDSIKASQLPEADIWWMSPPCTPYSSRGRQMGLKDPRAKSLINLLQLLEKKRPNFIFVENVNGFEDSEADSLLTETLQTCGYFLRHYRLCPTHLGVPMKRPRHFVVASRLSPPSALDFSRVHEPLQLSHFVSSQDNESLFLASEIVDRYNACMNIVSALANNGEKAICFTKGYYKCYRASGSFLEMQDGRVRRFAPAEILKLMGFSEKFQFPDHLNLRTQWSLLGNTVHVDSIRHLLRAVEIAAS